MTDFVSLHNRTNFSILTALPSPKDYFIRAKELNQKAVAITDCGSFAGVWDALKASKETGVKLIIGCEFYFVDDLKNHDSKLRLIVLIAKNAIGYKNILTLNKVAFDNSILIGKRVYPLIDWALLEKYSKGVICLTGCGNGIVSNLLNNKKFNEAEETLLKLNKIFESNLGVEIQAHNLQRNATYYNDKVDQVFTNTHLIRLALKNNLMIVPTTFSHYLKKEDAEVHDVLLAIGSMQPVYSNARIKYNISDLYLKSGDEVKTFFSRNYSEEFAENICKNSIYLADLCETPDWIDPKFSNPTGKELPIFPVEKEKDFEEFKIWIRKNEAVKDLSVDEAYLRFKCYNEFDKLKITIQNDKIQLYYDRINLELDVLEYQGFSSYMLIVADYVNWAAKNNIPVGPGRGSVGGCFVAYLLGIHKADSIKYGLIFERFQNKLRSQAPDIDQDVSTIDRERVLSYLKNKYGEDHMCAISNYNAITPKVYMRDIARSCDLGGSKEESVKVGNTLADTISANLSKITDMNDLLDKSPLLGEYCKKYTKIIDNGIILGQPRAASQHAAGIIISNRPVIGLAPVRKDKTNSLIIEFDKDQSEQNGFIKMDILGLSTLDIIQNTVKEIIKSGCSFNNEHLNYDDNDNKTYELICKGDTFKVFQLGTSDGTIDLCKRIKPKNIEDLSIITTLARPAAANIRNDFILAREGKRKVSLLHSSLTGAFEKTYGFGLFDESILQLGKDVAGWDLNAADRIRKMIKEKNKNPESDLKLRSEFIEGAVKNNIPYELSKRIWDEEIAKFASYTFNKSHAVLYSFISYQTAYLKAHFPIYFLLENLKSEAKSNAPDADFNKEKIKKEIRYNKVKILPPNINTSQLTYTLSLDNILTGLDALKFVGDEAINDIISKRPFVSFNDFMSKVNSKFVRSNSIQAMAATGCLDSFVISRRLIYLYCSDYRKKLQTWSKKNDPKTFEYHWPIEKDWSMPELYALEKSYLGESFICNKSNAYVNFFDNKSLPIKYIKEMHDKENLSSIKAEIKNIFEFKIKKEGSKLLGEYMVKALIEDQYGDQITLTIFPKQWKDFKSKMRQMCGNKYKPDEGLAIHFSGTVNLYEDQIGIIMENFFNFCPPPALPKDLKSRQTSTKKSNKTTNDININNVDESIDDFTNLLFDEGMIDLFEEDED